MKTLKSLTIATLLVLPLSAHAMCGGDMEHAISTAAVCDAGQVWDAAQEACVATVG